MHVVALGPGSGRTGSSHAVHGRGAGIGGGDRVLYGLHSRRSRRRAAACRRLGPVGRVAQFNVTVIGIGARAVGGGVGGVVCGRSGCIRRVNVVRPACAVCGAGTCRPVHAGIPAAVDNGKIAACVHVQARADDDAAQVRFRGNGKLILLTHRLPVRPVELVHHLVHGVVVDLPRLRAGRSRGQWLDDCVLEFVLAQIQVGQKYHGRFPLNSGMPSRRRPPGTSG